MIHREAVECRFRTEAAPAPGAHGAPYAQLENAILVAFRGQKDRSAPMAVAQSDRVPDDRGQLPARYPFSPEAIHPDDEISLIDLWLILVRRKILIAVVFAAALAFGLAVALLTPKNYEYTTSVQIARTGTGLLESPETVRAKLEASFIPFVLNEQVGSDSEGGQEQFDFEASIPGGQIILLKSVGPRETEAQQTRLHQAVVDRVSKDQAPELEAERQSLTAERARIEGDLEGLQDEARMLANREGRLEQERELIEKELAQTAESLEAARARGREFMAGEGRDQTAALILVRDEIQGYRQRWVELDERLNVTLPAQREELRIAVAKNRRDQAQKRSELQTVETKIAKLRGTQAIVPTMRSRNPTGAGKAVIMVLAAVAGLMLAVFAAFFTEFLGKVRERVQTDGAGR